MPKSKPRENLPQHGDKRAHGHQQGRKRYQKARSQAEEEWPNNAYCHLPNPRPQCSSWIYMPLDEKEGWNREKGKGGQASSHFKGVTVTQLPPGEERRWKQHIFTHERLAPSVENKALSGFHSRAAFFLFGNLALGCKMENGRGLEFSLEERSF